MTNERWQLAYSIYEAAAPLSPAQRQEYVHTTAPDAEIAGKVLAMLDEMESTGDSDALSQPAYSSNSAAAPSSGTLPNGSAIGRFVISGFVGQGGMGESIPPATPT